MKKYLGLLFLIFTLPAAAQIEEETTEDSRSEIVADSTAIDSLVRDSVALPWPQSVQHYIDRLLQADMFKTSQVGLMIYDLDADSAIVRVNERQLMRPASTMKIITAIAAIDRLGGSYRFKTELCYTGRVDNNVLAGDVYCVGGFDPRFNSDDLKAYCFFGRRLVLG